MFIEIKEAALFYMKFLIVKHILIWMFLKTFLNSSIKWIFISIYLWYISEFCQQLSLSAYDRRRQVMTYHGDLPWGYFCCRSVEVQKIFMMHIIYVLSAVLRITISVYGKHHWTTAQLLVFYWLRGWGWDRVAVTESCSIVNI